MANVVSVILARGGSRGFPGKNIIDFCGKPLIVYTIEQQQQQRQGKFIRVKLGQKFSHLEIK